MATAYNTICTVMCELHVPCNGLKCFSHTHITINHTGHMQRTSREPLLVAYFSPSHTPPHLSRSFFASSIDLAQYPYKRSERDRNTAFRFILSLTISLSLSPLSTRETTFCPPKTVENPDNFLIILGSVVRLSSDRTEIYV